MGAEAPGSDDISVAGQSIPEGASVREDQGISIYQVVGGAIVPFVSAEEFHALGYRLNQVYVAPKGALASVPTMPADGTLVRERSDLAVYVFAEGIRYWITSPEVLSALGYSFSDVHVVANGALSGIQRGDDITSEDLTGDASSIDTTNTLKSAHASSADSGWKLKDADDFTLLSADHGARAIGSVRWYYGQFPFGYRHRGEYSDSPIVLAEKPVGCIWAQIKWGYLAGSVSFPPGASVQGAEKVDGFFVNCRTRGSQYPAIMSLAGLAYAKALLNSSTLTICTSMTKHDGPRYCGTKKMYYGLG
jgi:hypothetical protein